MKPAALLHRALRASPVVVGLALLPAGMPLHAQGELAAAVRLLDGFDDATPWTAHASDQVKARLRPIDASADPAEGKALCLDFDFNGVSGYAIARRALPLEFPGDYAFGLKVRGEAPPNDFQVKLVDASGENVWWFRRADFAFPRDWQVLKIKKRHIEFAWGPAKDRTLRRSATLELVVAAGRGGGRGTVCFDQLTLRALPERVPAASAPRVSATSAQAVAGHALDGRMDTAWRSDPGSGPDQALVIDFEQPREFGGIVLHWQAGHHASRYEVQLSDDGKDWATVRAVIDGNGGEDALYLPESEARFVRLRMHGGAASTYAIAEIELKDLAFGATPNAFFQALARLAPRGRYPRGFSGEQSYWTIVGIDGGGATALLSEDGAIESGKGGFSIEPFLVTEHGLVTWADVESSQSLQDGYLPIPSVHWRAKALALDVTAFADGTTPRSQLLARYTVTNPGDRPQTVTLALAVRPFQVNPPTQFLNTPGGVHPIHSLAWDRGALLVDGERRAFALSAPDAFVASTFDAGSIVDRLGGEGPAPPANVSDGFGYASGAMLFRRRLAPRSSETVILALPLTGDPDLPLPAQAGEWLRTRQDAVAAEWRGKLNRVSITLPESGKPVADTLRTALAHVLISRDGAALQPGTRSYARSWIRDGAMMVEGLLRLGHPQVAADFIRWYAPHQFADGKVPCCVDRRGADPVPENDSHGQLIFAVAELHRHTRDRGELATLWPHVEAAAGYMERLRQSERSAANRLPENRAFYGLMPASISHEGYSAKPMHSYWDDFWALKGYKDAFLLASVLGKSRIAARLARQRDEFQRDLHRSIRVSVAKHAIDYLPGAAELGDFDATSTTIALSPAGEQANLPPRLLHGTFERYWREFAARRAGAKEWEDYTPYELRTIASFVRLGWRERAQELMTYFFADRRPVGWNQWAEVVGRDARKPRFVGDMPHAWVASDFIRSALDLFAYEREADRALVLAAGVPAEWLSGEGVAIRNLRTPYGALSYTLDRDGGAVRLRIAGGLEVPPGGLIFAWPDRGAPGPTRIDGRSSVRKGGEIRIHALPAEVTIGTAARKP